jgi:hypothetical protein
VHLEEIEAVGLKSAETLLNAGPDVLLAVVMGIRGSGSGRRRAEEAPALGRQEIVISTMTDVASDQLLAAAVVDGGVNQIDALISTALSNAPAASSSITGPRGSPLSSIEP